MTHRTRQGKTAPACSNQSAAQTALVTFKIEFIVVKRGAGGRGFKESSHPEMPVYIILRQEPVLAIDSD